jgi:hypothetical protein
VYDYPEKKLAAFSPKFQPNVFNSQGLCERPQEIKLLSKSRPRQPTPFSDKQVNQIAQYKSNGSLIPQNSSAVHTFRPSPGSAAAVSLPAKDAKFE